MAMEFDRKGKPTIADDAAVAMMEFLTAHALLPARVDIQLEIMEVLRAGVEAALAQQLKAIRSQESEN